MKQLATFFSVIALIWAAAASLRFAGSSLPWSVPAYLIAQCLFALVGWWGLQRASLESRGYLLFFAVGFAAVLLLACAFAFRVTFVFPRILAAWLLLAAFFAAACVSSITYFEVLKIYGAVKVPPQLLLALFQGGVLSCAGVVTFSTLLHAPLAPELRFVATAFGAFWITLGILAFGWAVGVTRNRQVWLHLNDFLPAFLAIVAFTWLAIQLSGLQRELSRQPVPQTISQKAVA